jgi:ubiquinone/menaquinone biosynthesis C-methylase UbiE
MSQSLRRQFDSVDRTVDPSDFVQYLDTTRATNFIQEIKQRTIALMDLHPGESALDVGCGTGEDVWALAAKVSPGGRAVGVDVSSTMITTARQRAGESKSSVEFVQSDVQSLAFEDGCFDAVRGERLLQHTSDPEAALREMVRVAKRGGRIVIWEGDLDLFVIDAPDYATSRIVQRFICDSFRNGDIGHRLYRFFLECGLVDVQSMPRVGHFTNLALIENAFDLTASVERAVAQNVLQSEPAMRWLESLSAADRLGRFFSAVGGFITFGRKM